MLDGFRNLAAVAGLMKDLPRIKARMAEVKARLGEQVVTASRGGGAVSVAANGLLRVLSISIDPAMLAGLVDRSGGASRAAAEALIAEAVNDALQRSRELAERELSAAAGELGLPVPPGALDQLLG
jgi:hypothetical protein